MSWHLRDRRRFEKEVEFMQTHSRARLVRDGGELVWTEDLVSNLGRPYRLAIAYPDRFPHESPRAYVLSPSVEGAPHRLSDGALCLFGNVNSGDVRTTALTVRGRAIAWFLAYEIWKATGQWMPPSH